MKKPKALHNFYKSENWKLARELKIMAVNGLCERCGQVGIEVHHKERLNVENVNDVSVCLNPENLELLCRDCHNKEHKRFSKEIQFDEEGNPINTEKSLKIIHFLI
jgi:5-methylcytosine-specific restriction endonuclease McrA